MSVTHDIAIAGRAPASVTGRAVAEGRALVRLAVPIGLIALVNMGMAITDAAMVSALVGADALAAVAIGSDLYSIVFYLAGGIVGGLAPFYAAAAARSDGLERDRLARLGWCIAGGAAAVAAPVVWTAPDWLAGAGLQAGLLEAGRGYTRAMALTLVPMLGVMLYRTLLTSAERPRLFLQVTLGMLPVNALANYALIMGFGPVPALGPAGAGVSSLLVATATLLLLIRVHRKARGRQPEVPGLPAWAEAAAVLRVGVPIGIATVGEVGIFLAVTLYAGRLGTAEVAAHTLALRAAGVAYAIPAALLQASLVRMARAESAGDPAAGRAVVMAALAVSLTAGAGLCAAFALGATPLSAAFFDTTAAGAAAAAMAAGLLTLLGAMELFGAPGAAASGLLRGRKDARAPMLATLFGHWAVGAPLGVFLCEAQQRGVTGLWIGLLAGTAVSSVLVLARLVLKARYEARPRRQPGPG